MSRNARVRSESGIYHVMLRGNNRQQIFLTPQDNQKFLQVLKECKALSGFRLLAYCLMGNHVHLLIKEGNEELGQIFKRIGSRFVYWYNAKYQRVGHLFQDRFKCEAVENQRYLFTVIRYIHQNPLKAGLCTCLEDYPYSSYQEYLRGQYLVDMDYVTQYISREAILTYSKEAMTEECLDMAATASTRMTDEEAIEIIRNVSGCRNVGDFQKFPQGQRDFYLFKLKNCGISARQISRLTGVSYYTVQSIRGQSLD
ncbi:MAG: transposase [Ruminococcaceae bacterium]|nr:transposase [Oscillospiraceae bacterium]